MKTKAQKQKTLKELANAITVRNHVMTLLNGPRGFATKDEVTRLRAFVTEMDEQVKMDVLALDAPTPAPQPTKKDLDMAKARAKMDLEKKEATMRAQLTSGDDAAEEKKEKEVEKPVKGKSNAAKKTATKTAAKVKPQGVVKRVLD